MKIGHLFTFLQQAKLETLSDGGSEAKTVKTEHVGYLGIYSHGHNRQFWRLTMTESLWSNSL